MSLAFDPQQPGVRRRVGGVTLHMIEAGPEDGPLVILLHGFPEFWWGWRYQIAPLVEAGFRVLVPDQRGYNLSDKPQGRRAYDLDILAKDVIGLADAVGRTAFSLVGHDWGGLVAWWTASRYPERVAKLAILNAPHPAIAGTYMRRHPSQMVKSLYVGFFQIPRLPEAVLSADNHRSLKDALLRTSRPGTFSEQDIAGYEQAWSQPGALTAMLNWYRALPFKPDMNDPGISSSDARDLGRPRPLPGEGPRRGEPRAVPVGRCGLDRRRHPLGSARGAGEGQRGAGGLSECLVDQSPPSEAGSQNTTSS